MKRVSPFYSRNLRADSVQVEEDFECAEKRRNSSGEIPGIFEKSGEFTRAIAGFIAFRDV